MEYSETLLDHFHHPRNAGALDAPEADGRGRKSRYAATRFASRCGSATTSSRRCGGRRSGCPPTIAAVSAASVLLEGCTLPQARTLDRDALATALGGIPARKAHAAVAGARHGEPGARRRSSQSTILTRDGSLLDIMGRSDD